MSAFYDAVMGLHKSSDRLNSKRNIPQAKKPEEKTAIFKEVLKEEISKKKSNKKAVNADDGFRNTTDTDYTAD